MRLSNRANGVDDDDVVPAPNVAASSGRLVIGAEGAPAFVVDRSSCTRDRGFVTNP
jgi:hypothetical protein